MSEIFCTVSLSSVSDIGQFHDTSLKPFITYNIGLSTQFLFMTVFPNSALKWYRNEYTFSFATKLDLIRKSRFHFIADDI